MAEFDFSSYLAAKLHPSMLQNIETLSGGLVNLTFRANGRFALCNYEDQESIIVKYAPPFIASLGPEAKFSTERQNVEVAALRLFQPDGGILSHIASDAQIQIPQVSTLAVGRSRHDITQICSDIGRRVGIFFNKLHKSTTREKILEHFTSATTSLSTAFSSQPPNLLAHNFTRQPVREATVSPILGRLKDYKVTNADILAAWVEDDFERRNAPGESCFSLGDCHPGSILVTRWEQEEIVAIENFSSFNSPRSLSQPAVAVIDWEFSNSEDRGINGDIAQLLASLHCLLIDLSSEKYSLLYLAVRSFAQSMVVAYRNGAPVVIERTPSPSIENDDRKINSLSLLLLRSAMILHGREMINQAIERSWTHGESSTAEMVSVGTWYIIHAADNVDTMIQDPNWNSIWSTVDEEDLLLSIFNSDSPY